MSSSPDNARKWIEHELRRVPLPEGMLARLKAIAGGSDEVLDRALCDVELPTGLAGRLKLISEDEPFDDELRNVPVPAEFLGRLHDITAYTDAEIDAGLRDVALPDGLNDRLRGIAGVRRAAAWSETRLGYLAVAASLMLAVGSVFFSALGGIVATVYQSQQPASRGDVSGAAGNSIALLAEAEEEVLPLVGPLTVISPNLAAPAIDPEIAVAPPTSVPFEQGAGEELVALFRSWEVHGIDPLRSVFLSQHDFLATPVDDDPIVLEALEAPRVAGAPIPPVKQFDVLSLVNEGVFPFVSPDAHPSLEQVQVPLVTGTQSFDLVWRALRSGQMPVTSDVRVEHFLAAVDYELRPASGNAATLHTAVGPSPFGESEMKLLQVAAQGGSLDTLDRQPVHLTALVDVSATMAQSGRLDEVSWALVRLLEEMGQDDVLTVLAFDAETHVVADGLTHGDAARLTSALAAVVPGVRTDFAGALRDTARQILASPSDVRGARRLMMFSDAAGGVSGTTADQLAALAADMARAGVRLDVVQLAATESHDGWLDRLAEAGGGRRFSASTSGELRHVLKSAFAAEALRPVAHSARLSIRFNPRTVAEYRLLGHEPVVMGGLLAEPVEVDLLPGETATALLELKLRTEGGDDIAEAVLTWHDPVTGRERSQRQRISRLQIATSLLESRPSLLRAAVAAEVAEVLRGSKFAARLGSQGLRNIADVLAQLPKEVRDDPSFQRLAVLLAMATDAAAGRATPRRETALQMLSR